MTARPISSTYRLQLTPAFGFDAACAVVPYLADLGVSHLYLSPVLEAVGGSTHGYDVVDPTRVRAALGGRPGLVRLAETAHEAGLGLVIDIVPNHLGVARPEQNPWWWSVLRSGRRSDRASFFDIDWSPDNGAGGKLVLPVLGSGDDGRALTVDRSGSEPVLRYYDKTFPVDPSCDPGPSAPAAAVHNAQCYRLLPWDCGIRSYRRFFTVDDLAGVRVQDPAVFAATHAQILSWVREGIADGLRIDHPDGLADPLSYLRRLREAVGPRCWIVIEKILEPGEPLEPTAPVAGTTGYDALREIGHALIDPTGEPGLTLLHRRRTGDDGAPRWDGAANLRVKAELAAGDLRPEFGRLGRAARRETGASVPVDDLASAALAWLQTIPYYRDDYPAVPSAAPPGDSPALAALAGARALGGESAARFSQLCGALTAKTVEDTAFYRSARLTSLQEVGGDPCEFGPADPHPALAARAESWPAAMTTLSTHDTKRGEDVRARIGVLSQCPDRWAAALDRWAALLGGAAAPDPAGGLLLWQTAFGVWPAGGAVTGALRDRMHAYAQKAMREGGIGTSWTAVDAQFEGAGHAFLDAIFDGPVAAELTALVADLDPHGRSDSLAQKLLQLAGPGVPDVYQGTEVFGDSLVDPDNRRPVDFAALARAGRAGHPKARLVREALRLRRERPACFVGGSYAPLQADGDAAGHVLGFRRGVRREARPGVRPGPGAGRDSAVIALATRWSLRLAARGGWLDTTVALPPGDWTDRLTGRNLRGVTGMNEVFLEHPVALLVLD